MRRPRSRDVAPATWWRGWAARLVAVSLLLLAATAAEAREQGASGSALGVGDAVHSTAVGPAAVFFNPAGLHQFIQYAIETGYQFDQPYGGHVFAASAADSASNQWVAMGTTYSYFFGHELATDESRRGHSFRVAAATGFRGESYSLHLGTTYRYMQIDVGDSGKSVAHSMDVGALITVKGLFRFGITGHNLIPTGLSEAPRQLGMGVSVFYQNFLGAFDAVLDFDSKVGKTDANLHVGLEYAIAGIVPLRLGYIADRIGGTHYVTGGIGYVSKYVAVDFGFRQSVIDGKDNLFSLNVRAFIP